MMMMMMLMWNKHLVAAVDLKAIEGLKEFHESFQPAVGEVAAAQRQDVDVLRSVGIVLRRFCDYDGADDNSSEEIIFVIKMVLLIIVLRRGFCSDYLCD